MAALRHARRGAGERDGAGGAGSLGLWVWLRVLWFGTAALKHARRGAGERNDAGGAGGGHEAGHDAELMASLEVNVRLMVKCSATRAARRR